MAKRCKMSDSEQAMGALPAPEVPCDVSSLCIVVAKSDEQVVAVKRDILVEDPVVESPKRVRIAPDFVEEARGACLPKVTGGVETIVLSAVDGAVGNLEEVCEVFGGAVAVDKALDDGALGFVGAMGIHEELHEVSGGGAAAVDKALGIREEVCEVSGGAAAVDKADKDEDDGKLTFHEVVCKTDVGSGADKTKVKSEEVDVKAPCPFVLRQLTRDDYSQDPVQVPRLLDDRYL